MLGEPIQSLQVMFYLSTQPLQFKLIFTIQPLLIMWWKISNLCRSCCIYSLILYRSCQGNSFNLYRSSWTFHSNLYRSCWGETVRQSKSVETVGKTKHIEWNIKTPCKLCKGGNLTHLCYAITEVQSVWTKSQGYSSPEQPIQPSLDQGVEIIQFLVNPTL